MATTQTVCPRCSNAFECGIGSGACWCAGVSIDDTTLAAFAQYYDGCLCPDCLRALEENRPQVPTVRAFLASQLKRRRRRT
jgi:recombinational DNA repair protein (RecF pathway)